MDMKRCSLSYNDPGNIAALAIFRIGDYVKAGVILEWL